MGYTKGEWNIFKQDDDIHIENECSSEAIATLVGWNGDKVGEANAKLIACAPEMLKAMNEFIEAVESQDIIIQENTDNDGIEAIGSYLYQSFLRITKKATL